MTVSQLTRFFTCSQRLSFTAMSSQGHFFSNSAPYDNDNNGPQQCGPNVPMRCGDNSQNGPTRYNTQVITTVSNKMLCSSKVAHSILATIRTYSNESTNKSSDEGVFTSFQHVKLGFVPLSKFSSP